MKAPPSTPGGDVEAPKALLRRRFLDYRAGLSDEEYLRRSGDIIARAISLPELEAAAVVHVYWPMTRSREVDTRPLILWLESMKKQIFMPVVRTFSGSLTEEPRMTHIRFAGEAGLRPNRWGVSEPSGSDTVPIERIDAVVVPAVGAGLNGHRIGHGFGYYDEFLRESTGTRICLVYEECIVNAVPAEPHDVPVDLLITERDVIRPSAA